MIKSMLTIEEAVIGTYLIYNESMYKNISIIL